MKSKIMSILICIGLMIILTGCGNEVKTTQKFENGDLKYCSSQDVFINIGNSTKKIEVYEDLEHNKLVYATIYQGYTTDTSVVDNNQVKTNQKNRNEELKYFGSQNIGAGIGNSTKKIEIYEDLEHNKLVYVTLYQGYSLSVSVVDINSSNIAVADDNSKSNKN